MLFERLNVEGVIFNDSESLALTSRGQLSGLTVGCGDGCTQIVPIYEGFSIMSAYKRLQLGGCDVQSCHFQLPISHQPGGTMANTAHQVHGRETASCWYLDRL